MKGECCLISNSLERQTMIYWLRLFNYDDYRLILNKKRKYCMQCFVKLYTDFIYLKGTLPRNFNFNFKFKI